MASSPLGLSLATLIAVLVAAPRPGLGEEDRERPAPRIRFREVSAAWGIDFRHHHAGSGSFYMIETMGSGLAIFDFDGDGDDDIFFVDTGPLPGYTGESPRSRLFRNDGGGRFVDVTERAGIRVRHYGVGAVAGDVDADGDLDLYVTAFGPNQLFANNGDGSFTDVTAAAGVGDPLWSASATLADLDRDGDLDLYVTNYVDFGLDNNKWCGLASKGLRSYCHPDVYEGLPDSFFRNRGDGTFEPAREEAGFGAAVGKGLGVISGDLDLDGWPDLYVANDMTPNYLFRNLGDGTFEEIGLLSGTAMNDRGQTEAGMGLELGDIDGNGFSDLLVTHLDTQTNAFYANTGTGMFLDGRFVSRFAEPSLNKVGFGIVAADFDHDGDLDVAVANGHIIHNAELWGTGSTFRQRNQLLENVGGGRFEERAEAGFEVVEASRGMAAGDLDSDGDLDLVVSNSNAACEVYENVTVGGEGWMRVDLRAAAGNLHAVGARVEIASEGRVQVREVRTASSYLSQNSLTLHFGLGPARRVDRLELTWPDGRVQLLDELPVNSRLQIVGRAATEAPSS